MVKKILIAAGGTGGHIFPALAIAKALTNHAKQQAQTIEIKWLGAHQGMEHKVIKNHPYQLFSVYTAGIRGKNVFHIAKALLLLMIGFWQTLTILIRYRPNVVVATGGYASALAGITARLLRIPLVIQEQNAIAGTTNKILAKLTPHIFQAFDHTLKNATTSGNPVLFTPQLKQAYNGKLNVLILGGSLGAKTINDVVCQLDLVALAINIQHQTGAQHIETINDYYQKHHKNVKACAFIDDMASAYAWADVVICRAGAMTISELMISGSASILIPLPWAIDDHQLANAQILQQHQAAILLSQSELNVTNLSTILTALTEAKIIAMQQQALSLAKPDAADNIAHYILSHS